MAPSGANGSFTGVVGAGNLGTYVSLCTSQSTFDSVGCYSLADHEEGLYTGGEFYLDPVSWTESAGVQSVYDASGNQTSTGNVRGTKNLNSLSTSSTSVQCTQNYSARMTITKGEYWLDSWTLGSYVLTGTTSLAAQQSQSSGSNTTEWGTDSSGNSFTQTNSSQLSQSTVQSQFGVLPAGVHESSWPICYAGGSRRGGPRCLRARVAICRRICCGGAAGFRLGVSTAGHAAVFPTRFGHWPSDW